MQDDKYVIGVDYGTDSVRTIIANTKNGEEIASSVFEYPRWKKGLYCDASKNQFRQHPLDYIEGLEATIKDALEAVGKDVSENILAISIDTTGSTPAVVNDKGVPLALLPQFENNPNAMFVLWKDHTALQEADEINAQSAKSDIDYVKYSGGIYSSEWFWSKLLHVLREDESIRPQAFSCVEHSDWMPFLLTGGNDALQIKRNVCAAGHKGLWAQEHGGFPPDDFFTAIDPLLSGIVKRINSEVVTADKATGNLCDAWAERLGLSTKVKVGAGVIDAHAGAIGGQARPYEMTMVLGTSTCDMLVVPKEDMQHKVIAGISGQVEGSIIPGMIGLEAGQAAFGDVYAWFKNLLLWPLKNINNTIAGGEKEKLADELLKQLSEEAAKLPVDENSELAVDWFNGRRTPDADLSLKGAITGLSLASDAPRFYRALVEATCFGAKKIVQRFNDQGIKIEAIIGVGGIARKSPYVMQVLADVLNMPIKITKADQPGAAGAAILAATVGGFYKNVLDAMNNMGPGYEKVYEPDRQKVSLYRKKYEKYNLLCNAIENG